jgi:hypothetical protein
MGDGGDVVVQLSCDIDDMNPEQLAHIEGLLFERGALDVVRLDALMKKGRQGTRLSVLCNPDDRDGISDVLLRETTTFGLRVERVERVTLPRQLVEVDTEFGAVRVKVGYLDGDAIKASPEYDDCAQLAAATGTSISRIYDAARFSARVLLAGD